MSPAPGRPVAGGSPIFRAARASRASTCATSGVTGRCGPKRSGGGGVTIFDTIDRKPFENATKALLTSCTPTEASPLIERIDRA